MPFFPDGQKVITENENNGVGTGWPRDHIYNIFVVFLKGKIRNLMGEQISSINCSAMVLSSMIS